MIFDCYGVLASDGWLSFKARYFEDDAVRSGEATLLNKAVDAGKASHDDLIRKVAEMAGVSEEVAGEQIENSIPDEKLFAYIKEELKPSYLIGLLSNAGHNRLHFIFTPEQLTLFDGVALSYEMGVIKPDVRAYEIIAERLQVRPEECIFVDDQPKFIEGAEQAGMRAILYADADQLKQDMPTLLADS